MQPPDEVDVAQPQLNWPPSENLEAYSLLFAIEVGLRELIIDEFSALDGPHWYKTRLPGDVLGDYKKGRSKEKSSKWTDFVHHDPLYYIDFPTLSKVMSNGSNWRDAFQSLFGTRDVLFGVLKTLEEIRNKVAHNRKVTQRDLETLQYAFGLIEAAIGQARLAALVNRCSSASGAAETLRKLRAEAAQCVQACLSCTPLPARSAWEATVGSTWLGMLSAEVDFSHVRTYFELLDEYDLLPESWPGFRIEKWSRSNRLEERFHVADEVLKAMSLEVMNGN